MTLDGRYLRGVHEAQNKKHLAQLCRDHDFSLVWWRDLSSTVRAEKHPDATPPSSESSSIEPSSAISPENLEEVSKEEISDLFAQQNKWKWPTHLTPQLRMACLIVSVLGLLNISRLYHRPIKTHPNPARIEVMEQLKNAGFYSHVPESQLKAVLEQDRLYASPLHSRESGRLFLVTERQWGSGAVARIFKDLSPFLTHEGIASVPLKTITAPENGNAYVVKIGEETVTLFTPEEKSDQTFMDLAPRRLLRGLNRYLATQNSNERAYWRPNGAESVVLFLTQDQFSILQRSNARDAWATLIEP